WGKPLPESRDILEQLLRENFEKRKFKLQYEYERFAYREVARSTDERTIIAAILPKRACAAHTLIYLNPYRYEVDSNGDLEQRVIDIDCIREVLCLANSLTLNFYIRSKVSAHVSAFQFLE